MDWTQTLTFIGIMLSALYAFYHMIERQIEKIEKNIDRHDQDINQFREEISKRDALWADLLREIHSIKLGIAIGNQVKGL